MSTPPSASTNPQDAMNLGTYATDEIARIYAETPAKLKLAEEAILGRLAPALRDVPLLDVGMGGGRTTPHLLTLSRDYLGVDYSPEMVAACRAKYPDVAFRQCDARSMEELGREKFGFVFFSFNGIDSIDHAGRMQVLGQVHALLKPGGRFLFSSHNLRLAPERPWHPGVYDWSIRPQVIAYNLFCMARNTRNFLRHMGSQSQSAGYGVMIDSAHDFRIMNYYVDPAEQVRQLAAHEFVEIEVFDRHGRACAPDAPELSRTGHVHYLARKPADPMK